MQVAAKDAVLQDRGWTLLPEELRLPRHLLSTVSGRIAMPAVGVGGEPIGHFTPRLDHAAGERSAICH